MGVRACGCASSAVVQVLRVCAALTFWMMMPHRLRTALLFFETQIFCVSCCGEYCVVLHHTTNSPGQIVVSAGKAFVSSPKAMGSATLWMPVENHFGKKNPFCTRICSKTLMGVSIHQRLSAVARWVSLSCFVPLLKGGRMQPISNLSALSVSADVRSSDDVIAF